MSEDKNALTGGAVSTSGAPLTNKGFDGSLFDGAKTTPGLGPEQPSDTWDDVPGHSGYKWSAPNGSRKEWRMKDPNRNYYVHSSGGWHQEDAPNYTGPPSRMPQPPTSNAPSGDEERPSGPSDRVPLG